MYQGVVALANGLLQPEGDPRPGVGDLDQQGTANQGGHGDPGDGEHRQKGIGEGMAQDHPPFTQAPAPGCLHVVGVEGAAQVEAQGVGKDPAQ